MRILTAILVVMTLTSGSAVAQKDGDREGGPRGRRDGGMRGGNDMGNRDARGGREMQERGLRGREKSGGQFSPELVARLLGNEELVKDLGLTADQIKKFRDGLHEIQVAMIKHRSEMELAGLEQARFMTNEKLDEAALMAAVEKTGVIRTEMAKLRIKQLLLVKGTFTKEQLAKIKQLRQRRMEHMRRRNRDGDEGSGQRRPGSEGAGNWKERMNRDDVDRDEMREQFKKRMQERRQEAARNKGGKRDDDS